MSFVDVYVTRLLMLPSNGQLVCLRPVGILNPVKFNWNYLVFQAFAWPTSSRAILMLPGVNNGIILFYFIEDFCFIWSAFIGF